MKTKKLRSFFKNFKDYIMEEIVPKFLICLGLTVVYVVILHITSRDCIIWRFAACVSGIEAIENDICSFGAIILTAFDLVVAYKIAAFCIETADSILTGLIGTTSILFFLAFVFGSVLHITLITSLAAPVYLALMLVGRLIMGFGNSDDSESSSDDKLSKISAILKG